MFIALLLRVENVSSYRFERETSFVVPVIILQASSWIFSNSNSSCWVILSQTTSEYSRSGRMKERYIVSSDLRSVMNFKDLIILSRCHAKFLQMKMLLQDVCEWSPHLFRAYIVYITIHVYRPIQLNNYLYNFRSILRQKSAKFRGGQFVAICRGCRRYGFTLRDENPRRLNSPIDFAANPRNVRASRVQYYIQPFSQPSEFNCPWSLFG